MAPLIAAPAKIVEARSRRRLEAKFILSPSFAPGAFRRLQTSQPAQGHRILEKPSRRTPVFLFVLQTVTRSSNMAYARRAQALHWPCADVARYVGIAVP
jgi:hypothetical protein